MDTILKVTGNKVSKSSLSALILFFLSLSGISQTVSINTTGAPPDGSAGLDISIPNLGFLIPRVALTGTFSPAPLLSHVAGMIVYNTATAGDVNPGIYINNGTKWLPKLSKANASGEMLYWDGTTWLTIPAGQPGQLLQINSSGVPGWTGAGYVSLSTALLSGISTVAAVTGGFISSDGGSAVSARGVCWATTPNPTILNSKTIDGIGTGLFTSNITGLITKTVYYIRSYATNSTGTSYGNQLVFMTL
jgi:hypothetical protein